MQSAITKSIVSAVIATQLLPAFLVGATFFAASVPLVAQAITTEAECTAVNGTWTGPTDNGAGVINPGSCAQAGANVTAGITNNQKQQVPPDGCSINPIFFSFSACMKALMSWLGSWFLTMGAALLRVAGWVFDQFIYYIIVAFGKTMRDLQIMQAVEQGWTVFRDFSNILIIGFFVFIAISIILGLQEFGQKRLIANVLVIAVLMNFSLLFTKIVIDGSNFVAYQIYSQMARTANSEVAQFNTSEAFLRPMGIGEVWNTYTLVRENATDTYGFLGFVYGFIGGFMLVGVALVLFYGCFLILWRGVLFILLMLAAPYAFATYLIPSLAKGEYGWEGWWKMLINNAAFGPLLMIMLALSLSIVTAGGNRATVPLGQIIADPSTAPNGAWISILVYSLGAFLLFASMRLASSFAGSIGGGYNGIGKLLSGSLLLGGTGLASRFAVNNIGRSAALKMDANQGRIKQLRMELHDPALDAAAKKAKETELQRLTAKNIKLRETATRDFNALNTNLGKLLAGKAGIAAGKEQGGFLTPREKTAKEVAKQADDLALSKDDARAIATAAVGEKNSELKEALESQRQASESVVKSTEKLVQTMTQGHQKELNEHMQAHSEATQRKSDAEQQYLNRRISEQQRNQIIQAEDAKISDARAKITDLRSHIDAVKTQAQGAHYDDAKRTLSDATRRLGSIRNEEAREIEKQTKDIVESSHATATNILGNVHHLDETERNLLGKNIRKTYKNKSMTDILKTIQEESGGDKPETT